MDNIVSWWNLLPPEDRVKAVVGVIAAVLIAVLTGILKFVGNPIGERIKPIFNKKEPVPVTVPQPPQVVVNVLPQAISPPPVAAQAASTAVHPIAPILPKPLVGFVARRDKDGHNLVEYVSELLAKDNAFVALWGAGGIGKTALAAEIARASLLSPHPPPPSPDLNFKIRRGGRGSEGVGGEAKAVVWASADGRADFSLGTLLDAAATQLGAPDLRTLAPDAKAEAVRNLLAGLGDHVGDHKGSPLLVMDNFETVAEAEQTRIAEFLANAPCAALVTSRQLTPRARNIEIDAMGETEAREFVDKLIEVSPRREVFKGLDAKQIITTAEANPLVMEWVVAQIAQEAHEPHRVFDELAHGKGDAAQRVFDRSFNLPSLGDDGRTALLALTLFVPNATREALAEVAGLDAERANNAISRLVSLRFAETTTGNARIGVRGLTRELAKAHSEQDARMAVWGSRFVDCSLNYAVAHNKTSSDDFDALDVERENIMHAMNLANKTHRWKSVVDFWPSISEFSWARGFWDDYSKCEHWTLQAAEKLGDKQVYAQVLSELGYVALERADYSRATELVRASLEIFTELGDQRWCCVTLTYMGLTKYRGDLLVEAEYYYRCALEIAEKEGLVRSVGTLRNYLGSLNRKRGEIERAKQEYEASLSIFEKIGDSRRVLITLRNLGASEFEQGKLSNARAYFNAALTKAIEVEDKATIAGLNFKLAQVEEREGNFDCALKLAGQAELLFRDLKMPKDRQLAQQLMENIRLMTGDLRPEI